MMNKVFYASNFFPCIFLFRRTVKIMLTSTTMLFGFFAPIYYQVGHLDLPSPHHCHDLPRGHCS